MSGSLLITNLDVIKYQNIHKRSYGTDIDVETARKRLTMLVHQMKLVSMPITKDEAENVTKNEYGESYEWAVTQD